MKLILENYGWSHLSVATLFRLFICEQNKFSIFFIFLSFNPKLKQLDKEQVLCHFYYFILESISFQLSLIAATFSNLFITKCTSYYVPKGACYSALVNKLVSWTTFTCRASLILMATPQFMLHKITLFHNAYLFELWPIFEWKLFNHKFSCFVADFVTFALMQNLNSVFFHIFCFII